MNYRFDAIGERERLEAIGPGAIILRAFGLDAIAEREFDCPFPAYDDGAATEAQHQNHCLGG